MHPRSGEAPSTVGPNLSAPHRAEQESDAERNGERGVRPRLERLVDDVDHLVAHLLRGIDGFLPLGADIRHHTLDIRLRTAPGHIALGRENIGDLRGEPGHIVPQRLQIRLDITARGRGGFAALPRRLLDVSRRLPNRIPDRAGCAGRCAGHGRAPLSTVRYSLCPQRGAREKVPLRRGPRARQSGSLLSSGGNRWVIVTRKTTVSGTARNAPIGPHSQAQKAIASRTASGLSVSRRPSTVGVMNWPSIVASATNAAGGTSA